MDYLGGERAVRKLLLQSRKMKGNKSLSKDRGVEMGVRKQMQETCRWSLELDRICGRDRDKGGCWKWTWLLTEEREEAGSGQGQELTL